MTFKNCHGGEPMLYFIQFTLCRNPNIFLNTLAVSFSAKQWMNIHSGGKPAGDVDFNPNFDKSHYNINRFEYIYINFSNPGKCQIGCTMIVLKCQLSCSRYQGLCLFSFC